MKLAYIIYIIPKVVNRNLNLKEPAQAMTNIDMKKKHESLKKFFFENFAVLLSELEWSKFLLNLTEKKCNFLKNYYQILFPSGEVQILEEFERWQDQEMLKLLQEVEPKLKVREKIARALEIRIINIVSKSVILKQNALFLLPSNLLTGLKSRLKTCDLIWRYAGDKSDDFNYYSKRSLLFTVYIPARLVYLSDDSKNHIKTKEFIATSLENIINIASMKKKIKLSSIEDIPIIRMLI